MDTCYIAKGYMLFYLDSGGIKYIINDKEDEIKSQINLLGDYVPAEFITESVESRNKFKKYSLMSGNEFIKDVEKGYLTYQDGGISEIFVDGYKSNLGVQHTMMGDGDFRVTLEVLAEICKNHTVEVNWANR